MNLVQRAVSQGGKLYPLIISDNYAVFGAMNPSIFVEKLLLYIKKEAALMTSPITTVLLSYVSSFLITTLESLQLKLEITSRAGIL